MLTSYQTLFSTAVDLVRVFRKRNTGILLIMDELIHLETALLSLELLTESRFASSILIGSSTAAATPLG
jgi:hypothetical protein